MKHVKHLNGSKANGMPEDRAGPMGTEINIKGRIYKIGLSDSQLLERTEQFNKDRKHCVRNSPFRWLNQLGDKRFYFFCWRYIDDILGEGACERYFGGKRFTSDGMIDFMRYLADEIEKQRLENRRD